jgi:arginyl-tRNA synthetase
VQNLYQFENILMQCVQKNEPSILARYLITLAQSYSNFYNENKIIDGENLELQNARVYLSFCVGNTLKVGAKLLGIEMPNKM